MSKPADMLLKSARPGSLAASTAALLDECERDLRNANEALLYGGPQERVYAARQASATLAKLRGEQ